ncbi:uncharacterized protein Z520_08812 [Fonsecaea multimorphosa CBS 102226]|uniref:Uncharacterized protein n=1 Tax=Fonsecaea multimorphosa CBS 102226 TaxID=1442371 RepID=A0A0D2H0F3_9EURO|nr:uncharacterized protein Z520_08812 [Fonsecaea multimorphosa CBS 102226]KIX95295.1 hypothetical protein Z520_08812 [Fonsecaea multimorphosa CBS 102226]OAL21095.1 hypothetical protein AYO22_08252 [Fonsecaea multimorphosa]
MPGYVGFQLALELTNVLPVREIGTLVYTKLLDMARELRNSGSDIVVEADLASIFGRAQVSLELEKAFKAKVHISKVTPLHEGSEIQLRTGPGPTVIRAFQESEYFATIVTLSALSYFIPRESLARMIATGMAKRYEAGVPGASSPCVYEGVESTLAACCTQCGEFQWAPYREEIEDRIRGSMQDYSWSPYYTRLTPAVLLGAMDFLYVVKSLPANRIITLSSQGGFIPLTIWAHHILNLNVVITDLPGPDVSFGDAEGPHVIIHWRRADLPDREELDWNEEGDEDGPEISLHETDMTVLLTCKPEDHDSEHLFAAERHPLSGYGTVFLRRSLNVDTIISDDDEIYKEVVCLTVGFAIAASQRMARELPDPVPQGQDEFEETGQTIRLETWRIMESAKLLFAGITIDPSLCRGFATFISQNGLTETTLPSTFNSFFAMVPSHRPEFSPQARMIRMLESATKHVLIFAHVAEVGKCGDMPIILTDDIITLGSLIRTVRKGNVEPGLVRFDAVFDGVSKILSSGEFSTRDKKRGSAATESLCSDFGWSVLMTTYDDLDPGDVRPELVHIRKGTPTNSKTGERKLRILDGIGIERTAKSYVTPVERGEYTPRTFANHISRKDYYVTLSYEFQITLFISFESTREWQKHGGSKSFQQTLAYSQMAKNLFNTHLIEECSHKDQNGWEQPKKIQLGPDVVAMLGGSEELLDGNTMPEKIIILLTKGDRYARWHAITWLAMGVFDSRRKIALRSNQCCESCALDYLASQKGKWYLVL